MKVRNVIDLDLYVGMAPEILDIEPDSLVGQQVVRLCAQVAELIESNPEMETRYQRELASTVLRQADCWFFG
ncbi:hypothetical protein [Cupriavidus sp. AcVe19-6a]|uniref:hypothetical protein n=1 Tax=Cupriavidus sp. AcVe19-6a TaxID=2821358 RepID=UPI001AE712F7|nr:hypothetical protein [Cupriavidus sp. AcVe19-6a]MBP0634900.1 hypothetical protein [Cupriavidus sp. AcVe19-6a]